MTTTDARATLFDLLRDTNERHEIHHVRHRNGDAVLQAQCEVACKAHGHRPLSHRGRSALRKVLGRTAQGLRFGPIELPGSYPYTASRTMSSSSSSCAPELNTATDPRLAGDREAALFVGRIVWIDAGHRGQRGIQPGDLSAGDALRNSVVGALLFGRAVAADDVVA